eukprot:CAMPEP_0174262400 /NCGR_PEP_ID=MMETSP0439-20130205/12952_1 /TAXON_ID=0 /ORGANISM="Stereomyxa ramosa, Strain Chinc5" /LENGTH=89 /DNA_ID=CAMNT_0015347099 /DNA_START=8 /DNA_END=273 /DNA_ORIENTATION=-
MSGTISEKELKDLREQLSRVAGDRDRLRLVTAAAEGHKFTCAQVQQLVEAQHFGDAQTQTSVLCYPNIVDPENFESVVLAAYPYDEDRA